MHVMVLGPNVGRLRAVLVDARVSSTEDPLSVEHVRSTRPDLLLSYGYRHIIPAQLLAEVGGRAVNLHMSYLPWNRGADPNLWSWLEGTPKGVSVHWMTAGLDLGPLVARREVDLSDEETLRSSYAILDDHLVSLLEDHWSDLGEGGGQRLEQERGGTYHAARDKEVHTEALRLGWDTPCRDVSDYGRLAGLRIN